MTLASATPAPSPDAAACAFAPVGLLAELTHRCPLQCPYCSNPLALERVAGELATEIWLDVLAQAADLGVLQLHLVRRRADGAPRPRGDRRASGQGRPLFQSHHRRRAAHARAPGAAGRAWPRPRADLDPGHGPRQRRPHRPLPRRPCQEAGSCRLGARAGPAAHPQRAHPSPEHRSPAGHHRPGREPRRRSGSRWRMCSTTAGRCRTARP